MIYTADFAKTGCLGINFRRRKKTCLDWLHQNFFTTSKFDAPKKIFLAGTKLLKQKSFFPVIGLEIHNQSKLK